MRPAMSPTRAIRARFQAGQFDTRFVEDRFTLEDVSDADADIAALVSTLVEHHRGQVAVSHIDRGQPFRSSRWKWAPR